MKILKFAIIALILATLPAQTTLAANIFNPNFIISDAEFVDVDSLDNGDIQYFLERGSLADYETEDIYGRVRSAADIIYWTAQTHGVNPKVLIVMLQKEQSLIEDPNPDQGQLDWALGYGVCDNCNHNTPSIQRWRGFAKQLNSAALQFVEGYFVDIDENGETVMGYGPGLTSKIDGEYVTFANAATAALYTYTPHLHGNENFYKLWNRYFGVYYPVGSLLQDKDSGGVYLIQYGEKRPITSKTALLSRYNEDLIVPVDRTILEAYPDGTPISYANYSLLQTPNGGIYLLVDDTVRPIASQEAFRAIGFNPDEVISVSWDELDPFTTGETITAETEYPQGALLQDSTTGGVYFVENGNKHPIKSREVLDNRFSYWIISPQTPEELAEYKLSDPVKFMDGTLVKDITEPAVYVISEEKRLPIPSEEIFLGLGYEWEDIVVTDTKSLEMHELGEVLDISPDDEVVEIANN